MATTVSGKLNNIPTFDEAAYLAYKQGKESAFNHFTEENCFWAFSGKQLDEGLAKFYDRTHDKDGNVTEKFVNLGQGMFCLKSKVPELEVLVSKKQNTLRNMIEASPDFARGAFLYEMCNHEYHINQYQGDWDVCDCFCDEELEFAEDKTYIQYLSEAGYSDRVILNFSEAAKEMFRLAEENDWY